MLPAANLKRLHKMCQPRAIILQPRVSFLFSGLARKKNFISFPCLTWRTTELDPEPGVEKSVLPHQCLAEPVRQFIFMLQRLPALPALPDVPYVREKQVVFFIVFTHWKQYPAHLPWAVMTVSNSWVFRKAEFSVFRKLFSDLWYSAQQKGCHITAAAAAEMPHAALTLNGEDG